MLRPFKNICLYTQFLIATLSYVNTQLKGRLEGVVFISGGVCKNLGFYYSRGRIDRYCCSNTA